MKNSDTIGAFNNPLIRFVTADKYRWLRHFLFIIVGIFLSVKGDVGEATNDWPAKLKSAMFFIDFVSLTLILGLIYFMLYVLIPKLLFRSKLFLFIISIVVIIIIIFVAVWYLDYYFVKPVDPEGKVPHMEFSLIYFIQIFIVCGVLLVSVAGVKVFKKWIMDVQQMNELQQINMKTELEQLKSQVNPHFLFNTLNNLLVLTKTDPEKATQVLLGLSDLLRYQLYDSAREKIVLSKDIAFIHNFLSLEKIRKNDFIYTIHTEGNMDAQMLPPFLFIPFVENAVKHGASTVGHSYLNLKFSIKENQLHFYSENSKPPVKQQLVGGLGLGNIKRRLELLYPDNHILEITDSTDKYIVNLTIPL